MIVRASSEQLRTLSRQYKAVMVTGPRQSGKTTLVRGLFSHKPYQNLENPDTRQFASQDPRGFLAQFPAGVILDEVQRVPELFSYLQQVLDESREPGRFILTGSNNFQLLEQVTQSLAGRVGQLVLLPFSLEELKGLPASSLNEQLWKGFYPPLYDLQPDPGRWYMNYLQTYLERDVRQVKNISSLPVFERFLRLLAGRAGQLLNKSSLAIETGVDQKTIESWIGVLEVSYVVYRLMPHHRNFSKRLVKMPKLYFYDTGLLCSLLGIQTPEQLSFHPQRGPLFENLVITELVKSRYNQALRANFYFWRDNTGHEIDLLQDEGGQLWPVEIKSGSTLTDDFFGPLEYWMRLSGTKSGTLVYGGDEFQDRSNGIRVVPWRELARVEKLRPQKL